MSQAENEGVLQDLCRNVRGVIVAVHEAIELMSYFRKKAVLQRTVFRGTLEISSHLQIPVSDNNDRIHTRIITTVVNAMMLKQNTLCIKLNVDVYYHKIWSYVKTLEQKVPSLQKISAVALQGLLLFLEIMTERPKVNQTKQPTDMRTSKTHVHIFFSF